MAWSIRVLADTFSICRLSPEDDVPHWARGEFSSVTRTPRELSIVCPSQQVPLAVQASHSWRCLLIDAVIDFSTIGVIAEIAGVLAARQISVFVMSTFDTDYLLVRDDDLNASLEALTEAGWNTAHAASS